ncbi:MAG: hypothetical protein V9G29_08065 [Burkholderiaceae bacterium]
MPATARRPRTSRTLKIRNNAGEMVPLGAMMTVEPTFGPDRRRTLQQPVHRPTSTARPKPGFSSGEAPGRDGEDR